MTTSDEDLARSAAGGDRTAFGALVDRHYDRLYRLAFRLTGIREVAEDLTQDICVALPRKLRGYRGDARFTTWLYRVAVNAAHDQRRKDATRSRAGEGWGDWEVNRRASAAEDTDRRDWLTETMRALPDDLRDTLALTLDEGMTHAEAARVLDVSEGTVSWRLSEIRKRLREMKEQEEAHP